MVGDLKFFTMILVSFYTAKHWHSFVECHSVLFVEHAVNLEGVKFAHGGSQTTTISQLSLAAKFY